MEDCMVWSPDDVYLYLQEPYADNHFGVEWTYHEDKMFECTLAEEGDIESPAFYAKILTRLPNHLLPFRLFLKGLEKCGKGDWRNISRLHVPSKTPAQVASHAQKYFRRIDSSTPVQKRRYSIHDTRIINSTIIVMAARCNELSVVQEELGGPMSGNFNRMPATSFLGYHNSINQGQYTQRSFSTPFIDAGSPQLATAIGR